MKSPEDEFEMPENWEGWECSECGAPVINENDYCSQGCFNAGMNMASKIIKNMDLRNKIELKLIQMRLEFLSEYYEERLTIVGKETVHQAESYRSMVTSLQEEVTGLNTKLLAILNDENI